MKSLTLLFCLGLGAVATHAASNCPMAPFPAAYSVETETTAGGNKTAMKMFVDGDKMRSEMDAGGMQIISIVRKDKKMTYSVMPAQKMVMENPLPDDTAATAPTGPEPVWEKVGSATVNGQACTEYKVTQPGVETMTYFLNADKLLVRMVTPSMSMDYKNYKAGAQDAALFEIPAGYSKPGEAPAPAASSDNSNSGAAADNPSAGDAPAATPDKPAKKKKLGMLGR